MKKLYIAFAVIALSACYGKSVTEIKPESAAPVEILMPKEDSVATDTAMTDVVPISTKSLVVSDDGVFVSEEEAYNEGYSVGWQTGYEDAIYHLEFGYDYNDEPEYSGFLDSYIQGYEDGYGDGYFDGREWDSDNE